MRLSINIDHVATIRNARGGTHPDPLEAALAVLEAGADGITLHLREDRRHIRDADVERIRAAIAAPLNLEMAATEEMVAIAERLRPADCCIVPEKRAELTTEGGLDVTGAGPFLAEAIRRLNAAGIRSSVFVEPDARQIEAAARLDAHAIELHTGAYADAAPEARPPHLARLRAGAEAAAAAGLAVHAGHGLSYETIGDIARIPEISEVSIGHFLIGQAVFEGLPGAVRRMKALIAAARASCTPLGGPAQAALFDDAMAGGPKPPMDCPNGIWAVPEQFRKIYAHARELSAGLRHLHVSGQLGVQPDGVMRSGFAAQLEQALDNVEVNLAATGMSRADIAKATFFLTRTADLPALGETRRRRWASDQPPAVTVLVVAALARPDALIEVEVTAAAPPL